MSLECFKTAANWKNFLICRTRKRGISSTGMLTGMVKSPLRTVPNWGIPYRHLFTDLTLRLHTRDSDYHWTSRVSMGIRFLTGNSNAVSANIISKQNSPITGQGQE